MIEDFGNYLQIIKSYNHKKMNLSEKFLMQVRYKFQIINI